MIKIAYILTPIEFGGSEKVNLIFLNHVNRELFDIYPILLTRPWEKDNFFVRHLEATYPVFKLPVALRPRSEGYDHFRIIRCLKKLHSFLSENKIQLIHTHGYFADIIGVMAAYMLRIKHISTCHGFISNDRNLVLYNKLDQIALRFSDKIIAVSEQIKDDLRRNGIKKSKLLVIQNAVQATHKAENYEEDRRKKKLALSLKNDEFVIGYVGRLSEEKGVRYLIEAGMFLMKAGLPCKILIIGDGPKRRELEDKVKIRKLEDNIIFIGFQTNIEEWLPLLDIFVLPSLTEGTPMALLEAMSFGIPVIATRVGGVPKVITNGENGILVNACDPKMLADKIKMLFHNSFLREKIAKEAVTMVKSKHNIIDWCREIETQYIKLLKYSNNWKKRKAENNE